MTSPGWRKYECPLCKGQRVDREPKENQPPCKLCGHGMACIDENYGRFMTAPCNLGIEGHVLAPLSNEPNPYVGRMVVHDIN